MLFMLTASLIFVVIKFMTVDSCCCNCSLYLRLKLNPPAKKRPSNMPYDPNLIILFLQWSSSSSFIETTSIGCFLFKLTAFIVNQFLLFREKKKSCLIEPSVETQGFYLFFVFMMHFHTALTLPLLKFFTTGKQKEKNSNN